MEKEVEDPGGAASPASGKSEKEYRPKRNKTRR